MLPALLLLAAAAASAAGPSGPAAQAARPSAPASATAPAPVSPLVAAARRARAAGQAPMADRRVWTLADLEALQRERPGTLNVLPFPGATTIPVSSPSTARPQGVEERYRELVTQADAQIEKLERERMATTNPLLRGLAPATPRTPADLQAEIDRWKQRRDDAAKGLGEPR